MILRTTLLAAIATLALGLSAMGCSAETDDESDTSEDDVTVSRGLNLVKTRWVTFGKDGEPLGQAGAPAKIARVLQNLGIAKGTASLERSTWTFVEMSKRCKSAKYNVWLSDEPSPAARVAFGCQDEKISGTKNVKGHLHVPNTSGGGDAIFDITSGDFEELLAIAGEPELVGDVLRGQLYHSSLLTAASGATLETDDKAVTRKLFDTIELDAAPNAAASFPRCPAARTLTFTSTSPFDGSRIPKAVVSLPCEGAAGVVEAKVDVYENGSIARTFGAPVDTNALTKLESKLQTSGK